MTSVVKLKAKQSSALFERMNLERLRSCTQTAESAKQVIAQSQRLTEQARDLLRDLKAKRRRTGWNPLRLAANGIFISRLG